MEECFSDGLAFGDGDGGKVQPIGTVAHGKDVRRGGPRVDVNRDGALLVEPDADRFESKAARVRSASGREHHQLCVQRAAVGEVRAADAVAHFDALDARLEAQGDTALRHLSRQDVAHVIVEAAQKQRTTVGQRDVGSEPVKDGGELDGDVAADYEHTLRQAPTLTHVPPK